MIDYKTGEPHTAHTTNPVPIILVTDNKELKLKNDGKLADLAPTMLELMGIEKPAEMQCDIKNKEGCDYTFKIIQILEEFMQNNTEPCVVIQ